MKPGKPTIIIYVCPKCEAVSLGGNPRSHRPRCDDEYVRVEYVRVEYVRKAVVR